MPGPGVRRRAARARGAVVGAIVLVLLLTQAGIGRADTANDLDATTGSYGPGPVSGRNVGTDTTNRFRFVIPLARRKTRER